MSTTTVQADVTKDPDEIRAFPLGNYDGKPQRVIDMRWLVREHEANGAKVYVELGCWHHKERRAYVASVNNVQITPRDGYTSVESLPMSSKRVLSSPCARYSKASFEAFAAEALAIFREVVADGAGQFDEHLRGEHSPVSRFGD